MENGPDAPKAGNGRRTRSIEFDEADAPMLMAAMRLAAATAMTYGASQARARRRLKHYQALFLQFAPQESRMFREEEDWCEIAIAMDDAESFSVSWKSAGWPSSHLGDAIVTVGTRRWRTGDRITSEQAEQLAAALDEMAPAGCIRVAPAVSSEL